MLNRENLRLSREDRKVFYFGNPGASEAQPGVVQHLSCPSTPKELNFSSSNKEKEILIHYIKNQQEHHKKESFVDEIKRLFKENGIDLDEKWFWQDE
ncbi:MAG: hypothetical protein LBO74_13060 [Candidatus Symbiothrix sp.]|jgi:hypothetical protein|nr:hypothetical protein [Candidatus Symbiothrix sp.]